MVDINERSLFKNPYWERGNPNVHPQARQHINENYGTQLPQLAAGNPQAMSVQPQGPTVSPPLPSQQGGIMNALGLPKSDVTFGMGPNAVDQGIQSLSDIRGSINQAQEDIRNDPKNAMSPEEARHFVEMDLAGDPARAQAVEELIRLNKPLTMGNIDILGGKIRRGEPREPLPTEYKPVQMPAGEEDTPDEPTNEPSGPIATSKEEVDIMAMTKGYDGQRPDETLEEFAKRIGIRLSDKPYDNWDYIRDMSAGLLASKEDNFFGALGDAALLSNAQRDKAETSEDSKRTQLAVAKWRSDDDWEKLNLQENNELTRALIKSKAKGADVKYGKASTHDDGNGNVTTYTPILSGIENVEPSRIKWINNTPHEVSTDADLGVLKERTFKNISEIDNAIQEFATSSGGKLSALDDKIMYNAENISFNNELLAQWNGSENSSKLIAELYDSKLEGAKKLAKALEDGDSKKAFELANALNALGPVGASLSQAYYTGLHSQLSPGQKQEMKDRILREARIRVREKYDPKNPQPMTAWDAISPAITNVMQNMHWDEEGMLKFGTEYTGAELYNWRGYWDSITGQDDNNEWWTFALFNTQEFPEDHVFSDLTWQTPLNKPGENSLINKNQYELLSPDQQQNVQDFGSTLTSKLINDLNMSKRDANNDVGISLLSSNAIRGGDDGFDFNLGFADKQATFKRPRQWVVEPVVIDPNGKRVPRQQLRDEGFMWNGIRGEYFTLVGEGDRNVATPKVVTDYLLKNKFKLQDMGIIGLE